ncbi:MAG: hypothetical protein PHU53_05820 [Thermoplasmata archaeon]|nr:hypothetical protein [Thermoplasmata archaeon]
MKSKEGYREGWVAVKQSHVFNIPQLRELIKPGDKVMFLPKEIITRNVLNKRIKFIQVVTNDGMPFLVPLFILAFNEKQKEELISFCGAKKGDFETFHFSSSSKNIFEEELENVAL